jgi:hypothetical protein
MYFNMSVSRHLLVSGRTRTVLYQILFFLLKVQRGKFGMETWQMVIYDLRMLGVRVNQILLLNPSDAQLRAMRTA